MKVITKSYMTQTPKTGYFDFKYDFKMFNVLKGTFLLVYKFSDILPLNLRHFFYIFYTTFSSLLYN